MVGTTLGRYRIIAQLGVGGMGEVFVADDLRLDRRVALKILRHGESASQDWRDRFEREAKAVASLAHPNIVAIYDFGEDGGVQFAVTELLEGETLRARLAKGPVASETIAAWSKQLAEGLAAAHSRGVVHRDLKPENIFITRSGQVKILDFGLARLDPNPDAIATEAAATAMPAAVTREGVVLGTAGYMAPEQVRGLPVDARADVFALGAVLYEMAAGCSAFPGATPIDRVSAILNIDPQPLPRDGDDVLGSSLGRITARCLQKNPDERFQSARDVAFALEALGDINERRGPAVGRGTLDGRRFNSAAALILIGLVAVAAVAGAVILWRGAVRQAQAGSATARRIVVLPFETQGTADDEYFSIGLSEEIARRLANAEGLGVISRNSARQYANHQKTTQQIAAELGVEYIVDGVVRWDAQRVRVSPQLIRAADDTQLWSDRYDRDARELFAVQSEIADRVAAALDLTVVAPRRESVSAPPTRNVEAYQAYLRGILLDSGPDRASVRGVRLIVQMFERAVALDPNFALARARLSYAYSNQYRFGDDRTDVRLGAARAEAERALALQPDLPWAHFAMGIWHYTRSDYDAALAEFDGVRGPMASQSDLWAGIGGVLRRRGDTIAAVEAWQKAFALDPRSAELSREVATTLSLLRRYDEALSYFDKSIALAPDQELSYGQKARVFIQKSGDVAAARRVLEAAVGLPPSDEAWIDVEMFRRDYAAALARARLLPAEAATEQGGIRPKALIMARLHALAGEHDAARSAYDAAKTFLIGELERRPNDWRVHGALGMAYAGLDRKAEAIAEGRRAMDLNPLSRDAFFGAIPLFDLARIYAAVGEGDRALELIDQLLSIPSRMSVAGLKTDPSWDALRSSPAYGNLISRYESPSRN